MFTSPNVLSTLFKTYRIVNRPLLAMFSDHMHKQELLLVCHQSAFMCIHGSVGKCSMCIRLLYCCSHIHNKMKC